MIGEVKQFVITLREEIFAERKFHEFIHIREIKFLVWTPKLLIHEN